MPIKRDIILVIMPFASISRPNLGASLLKSEVAKLGLSIEIKYFNIDFAAKIGPMVNEDIANGKFLSSYYSPNLALLGEWIFSESAFQGENEFAVNSQQNLPREFLGGIPGISAITTNKLHSIKSLVEMFVSSCSQQIMEHEPKLVGFSSMFQQNCSSMSVARKLKMTNPLLPIIFGGANCEGEMGSGLLNCCPWIDFICSGEGDIAFVRFVESLILNHRLEKIPGIMTRDSSDLEVSFTNPVSDLNSLPTPDYDDYFQKIKSLDEEIESALPVESSRGCWWGEIMQCTFCGLNGGTMAYRSKSVHRFLNEVIELVNKYKTRKIEPVDNILDLKYIDSLFPALEQLNMELEVFYETKSNLSRKQLLLMKKGGVRAIQPGIESLSDNVLKIMKKGVTAIQNIKILKWCRELVIEPYWNFLWGFPGELREEYDLMSKLVPLLVHLNPPQTFSRISIDRFSPFFIKPSENGITNVRPMPAYHAAYPIAGNILMKIAYHFDYDFIEENCFGYTEELSNQVTDWINLWTGKMLPSLFHIIKRNSVLIRDTRPCAQNEFIVLTGLEGETYKICNEIHDLNAIHSATKDHYDLSEDNLKKVLSNLVNSKLVAYIGGKYLALGCQLST